MRQFGAIAIAFAGMAGTAASAADGPSGVWMTEERDSKIRIASCGRALCATILWAKGGGVDDQNPDPKLRQRAIVGLDLSRDIRPDGKGGWQASMYNPENGRTYRTTLTPKGGELEVGGCVLGGLICGSETWRRSGDIAGHLPSGRD
ncbi:DUF2147 domain-containing protein [Enterovirga rhinocerotis]|uniref:Uncharacterized protein (DUF2147 family) n=1 Tax=Enterovirga rhinocerotis TaxID=1339210 RepID=A0A4V3DYV5_9HYPH|nr:DUF2147 domain-containing protein [Enterovirga rhinocerotis]TDR94139.1 uncharacterized protein (DUF2147 family) [Enterovirga rhinocerotis]